MPCWRWVLGISCPASTECIFCKHYFSPVMVSTTKLTALVFSVHDGVHKKSEKLTPFQRQHAIRWTQQCEYTPAWMTNSSICWFLSFEIFVLNTFFVYGTFQKVPFIGGSGGLHFSFLWNHLWANILLRWLHRLHNRGQSHSTQLRELSCRFCFSAHCACGLVVCRCYSLSVEKRGDLLQPCSGFVCDRLARVNPPPHLSDFCVDFVNFFEFPCRHPVRNVFALSFLLNLWVGVYPRSTRQRKSCFGFCHFLDSQVSKFHPPPHT